MYPILAEIYLLNPEGGAIMKNSIVILLAIVVVLLALNLFSGYAPLSIAETDSQVGRYQISAWAVAHPYTGFSTTECGYFIIDTTDGRIARKESFSGK